MSATSGVGIHVRHVVAAQDRGLERAGGLDDATAHFAAYYRPGARRVSQEDFKGTALNHIVNFLSEIDNSCALLAPLEVIT